MRVSRHLLPKVAISVLAVGAIAMQSSAGAVTAHAAKPVSGGNLVESLNPGGTFDPASPALPGTDAALLPVFGGLFDAIGKTFVPDEATGYSYSKNYKTLTITLHKHMVFQDGTPFNSAAVKYNFERDSATTSTVSQDLASVSSITTPNSTTVVVHFSAPDANLINLIPVVSIDLIGSPTAEAREGASGFGLAPVGAGPFKLQSFTPSVSATFDTWSGYFAPKTRYLNSIEELNTGSSAQVAIEDLLNGSVQMTSDTSVGIAPSSIAQAYSSPSLSVVKGPEAFDFLPLNGTTAPFDNLHAREAIDYCLNRPSLVDGLMSRYGAPEYVLAAPTEQYTPNAAASKKLMPYAYNPSMGTQIVKSLGGLSFTLTSLNGTQQGVVAEGLAQMLEANCGIKVTVNLQSIPVVHQDLANGNFQAVYITNGGAAPPLYGVELYAATDGGYNQYGVKSAALNSLLNKTGTTDAAGVLTPLWSKIYKTINTLAMDIPFAESPNYLIISNCVHGATPFLSLAIVTHVWLSCS